MDYTGFMLHLPVQLIFYLLLDMVIMRGILLLLISPPREVCREGKLRKNKKEDGGKKRGRERRG